MTIGDAFMNTFAFLPALVLLGSLPPRRRRIVRTASETEPAAPAPA